MKKFDQFQVGEKAEIKHTITAEDIRKFVDLTGDDNPLHVDPAYAEKTSFKGVVAHGMLSASFISTIIGKHLPGEGALWVSQSLNFLLPVRIGDELSIVAEIVDKKIKGNRLFLRTEIKNQHKQIILNGESQVKVLETQEPKTAKEPREDQKVVLVTGSSRGIGAATALLLARQGYKVAINYRKDKENAERLLKQIRKEGKEAIVCQADVADEKAVQEMVGTVIRKYGTITALVNNATTKTVPQDFKDLEWDDVQSHVDLQVKGAFNCIKAVLGEFLKNKSGSVVNIGTIYNDSTPPPKLMGYVVAKNALHAMTKSLSLEYGPKGIRFNTVAPGMTETALISELPEKIRLVAAMQTPTRRLAAPEDVAQAIAFLLGNNATQITGETLRVCGGQVMI